MPLVAGDPKLEQQLADALQTRLLGDLKSTPASQFRTDVIEQLLVSNPIARRTVTSAYEHVQRLLRIVVAKLDLDWSKTMFYREDFFNRLTELFAKATQHRNADFDLLRATAGCVLVHFRIHNHDEKEEQTIFDELRRQALDPTSVLRQDKIGKHILYIKRWELTDGMKLLWLNSICRRWSTARTC